MDWNGTELRGSFDVTTFFWPEKMDHRQLKDAVVSSSSSDDWDEEVFDDFIDNIYREIAAYTPQDPVRAYKLAKRIEKRVEKLVSSAEEGARSAGRSVPVVVHDEQEFVENSADSEPEEMRGGQKQKLRPHLASKFRKMVVLEFLNSETRPVVLDEVQGVVLEKGFKDAGLISQLHRLFEGKYIEKPGNENGVYAITQGGRHHLAQLRKSFGTQLDNWLETGAV